MCDTTLSKSSLSRSFLVPFILLRLIILSTDPYVLVTFQSFCFLPTYKTVNFCLYFSKNILGYEMFSLFSCFFLFLIFVKPYLEIAVEQVKRTKEQTIARVSQIPVAVWCPQGGHAHF